VAGIPFTKVQGLGNDFIVVDLRPGRPGASARPSPLDPALARALCDRHFGIGADGVLAILPGEAGQARMRIINADGSEAEMCGNGLRCVAKVLYEQDPSLRRPVIDIDTGAGLLPCSIEEDGQGRVRSVQVQMGRPRLLRGEIPVAGPAAERAIKATVSAGGRDFSFTAVSMGNPHAVIFIDDPRASLRELAETYGPRIEVDPLFPRRTNVEFARVRKMAAKPAIETNIHGIDNPGRKLDGPPDTNQGAHVATGRDSVDTARNADSDAEAKSEIDLVVWERGCGITLACGTGACATAVAAYLEGRALQLGAIPIHLPGGTLEITVENERNAPHTIDGVLMRGPASIVFESEIDLTAFPLR
jgi:diaminopimelate epimerase